MFVCWTVELGIKVLFVCVLDSGAQGEYAGLRTIMAYHQSTGEEQRNVSWTVSIDSRIVYALANCVVHLSLWYL